MKKVTIKIMILALTVALLASLLLAVVPAGALVVISVAPSSSAISATNVTYTITFTGSINLAVGDTVTITFPAGFDLNTLNTTLAANDVTFNNGSGSGDVDATPAIVIVPAAGLITLTVPAGAAAIVGNAWIVKVKKVVNPGTAGSYTVAVSTSKEPTPVLSGTFNISTPGIIQLYNGSGAYLGTFADFTSLPTIEDGWTVKVSPGIFVNPPGFTVAANNVTLTSTGGPAPVIYIGALTVNGNFCTVSNMIIISFAGSTATFNGTNATVTGCTFGKTQTPAYPYSVANLLVQVNGVNFIMTGSTVDISSPVGFADIGIQFNTGANTATISDCTFLADQTVAFTEDNSIFVNGAVIGLNIECCSFTGTNGGIGYFDDAGATAAISHNTFTGLHTAIYAQGTTTISTNTISDCITNGTDYVGAVIINGGTITASGNTVEDNTGYSCEVLGGAATSLVNNNNFSNNANGFINSTEVVIDATNNYWGAASGPYHATNPSGAGDEVSDYVDYQPFSSTPSGPRGLLRIQTIPAVPTRIFLDGLPRNDWGLNWVKMTPGAYVLSLSDVYGYNTPTSVTVNYYPGTTGNVQALTDPINIYADTVTEVIVNFVQLGNLRVETSPAVPATIYCNGNPMDDWGFWCNIEPGEYTISFEPKEGYLTPPPIVVTVVAGAGTHVVGNYSTGTSEVVP